MIIMIISLLALVVGAVGMIKTWHDEEAYDESPLKLVFQGTTIVSSVLSAFAIVIFCICLGWLYSTNGELMAHYSLIKVDVERRAETYEEIKCAVEQYVDKESKTYVQMTNSAKLLAFAKQQLTSAPLVQKQIVTYTELTDDIYAHKKNIRRYCAQRFSYRKNPLSTWFSTPNIPIELKPMIEEEFPEYYALTK